jgi:cytochrome c-type biogenesis protein CcmE
MRSRLRFAIALGLAVVLGAWLAWTSLGGAMETYSGPGDLVAGKTYRLDGRVAPGAPTDAAGRAQSADGLRFTVLDKADPTKRVVVQYRGQVPDQFKVGREVVVTGKLQDGVFQAKNDSLLALCPSKFTDKSPEPGSAT